MNQRIALIIGLLLVAGVGFFFIAPVFESDEGRIRGVVLDLVEEFNARKARSMMKRFAAEYRDQTMGLSRETVAQNLKYAFAKIRNIKGRFPYRVQIPAEFVLVELNPEDRTKGSAKFALQVLRVEGADEYLEWEAEFTLGVAQSKDGWLVTSSSHETVSGSRPF